MSEKYYYAQIVHFCTVLCIILTNICAFIFYFLLSFIFTGEALVHSIFLGRSSAQYIRVGDSTGHNM